MTTKKTVKAASKKGAAAPAPAATKRPVGMVRCTLGGASTAGRLVVGNAVIESNRPGRIPRSEFDRLQAEYDLREADD